VKITLRFHTSLQNEDAIGNKKVLEIQVPELSTVNDVLQTLHIDLPQDCLIVVNHRIFDIDNTLSDQDIVDLIPILSGG